MTNGTEDNQPVVRDGIVVVHNGIVVNHAEIWPQRNAEPCLGVDTEVIAAIIATHLSQGGDLSKAADEVFKLCDGVISAYVLCRQRESCSLFLTMEACSRVRVAAICSSLPKRKRFANSIVRTSMLWMAVVFLMLLF